MANHRHKLERAVLRIAILILLGGMALSRPLWDLAARHAFPAVPLWGAAQEMTGVWRKADAGFLVLLVLSALAAFIFPARKWMLSGLLLCLAALCLCDLNRLQPWVWFSALLMGISLFSRQASEVRSAAPVLLAGVYAWGGFHKFTPYFAEDNFSWFCSAFEVTAPLGAHPTLGYGLAAFEFALGLGLLWRKTHRVAAAAAILFHLVILAALSPPGLNWNTVVMPWNAGMMFLLVLFLKTPQQETPDSIFSQKTGLIRRPIGWSKAVLAAAWFAPILNFAGLWPDALSWKLYTNTQAEATFYSKSIDCDSSLQAIWQKYRFDEDKMLLDDWAHVELKTPLFSTTRTFKQLGRYLCRCTEHPDSAGLYILRVQPWNKKAETLEKIPCRNLY